MEGRTTIDVRTHEVCIRIDGVPHLIVRRSEIVGIQAYVRSKSAAQPIYFMEVTTKTGDIVCDYEDRSLWEHILSDLAGAKLFDQRIGEMA